MENRRNRTNTRSGPDRSQERVFRSLRILLAALALTLLGLGPVRAGDAGNAPPAPDRAERAGGGNPFAAYFDERVPAYLEQHGITGAVVAVVKDGETAFLGGYGFADVARGMPMDAERSVVHIGSAGKTFTAVAVMQLVEQGKIDLDENVQAYLDFEIPATYAQPITIRHLLTHTSGFEGRNFGAVVEDPALLVPPKEYLVKRLPLRVRPPGEAVGYSNYGVALLGYVVQRVSGMSLSDYLDANVLAPLGMVRSSAQVVPPDWMVASMATGYQDGQVRPTEYVAAFGAGPVRATASDMSRYMNAVLQGGEYHGARILEPESVLAMLTRQAGADPRVNGVGLGFYEMSCNGQRILGHLGTTAFFHTVMFLLPEERLGVLVTFNSAEALAIMPSGVVLRDFMDHFYPLQAPRLEAPADFDNRAGQYTGVYFLNNQYGVNWIEKALFLSSAVRVAAPGDDTLVLAIGGRTRAYFETSPDAFQRQGDDDLLVFRRDASGQVVGASLSSRPVFTLERRPWFEAPGVTIGVVVAAALIFLASLLLPVFLPGLRIGRGRGAPGAVVRWAATLIPLLNLGFVIGFVALLGGMIKGQVDLPVYLVLGLPVLATPSTVVLAAAVGEAWLHGKWTAPARIRLSAVALAGVALALTLNVWNLLGWKL